MTSSYLEKPRRNLKDVLRANPGNNDESVKTLMLETDYRRRFAFNNGANLYLLGIIALLVGGGLAAAIALPGARVANHPVSDDVMEVAPASGPAPQQGSNPGYPAGIPTVPEAGTLDPSIDN